MKKYYLVALLMVVPIFASQGMLDEAIQENPNTHILKTQAIPIRFSPNPDETLSHGGVNFYHSVGICESGQMVPEGQTIGFATYFILSEHGISTPQQAIGVLIYWGGINASQYGFRLFLWSNVPAAMLWPLSHDIHLYYDNQATPFWPWDWAYYEISPSVAIPETVWVGICYNHMGPAATPDWYLAYDISTPDGTTYGNLTGTPYGWDTFTGLGEAQYDHTYGTRLVVTEVPDMNDVGPVSIDILPDVPWNTTLPPQATIKNFGNRMETFEVSCGIEPGGYLSTDSVIDLAAGDSIQVTFTPDFTFAMEDTYTVIICTHLNGDMDTFNDTMVAFITTHDPGIAEGNFGIPKSFSFGLKSNPSKGKAVFNMSFPEAATVTLNIYDITGRLIHELIISKSAGYYEIPWSSQATAGIYFYKLESPWNTEVGKLVLIR